MNKATWNEMVQPVLRTWLETLEQSLWDDGPCQMLQMLVMMGPQSPDEATKAVHYSDPVLSYLATADGQRLWNHDLAKVIRSVAGSRERLLDASRNDWKRSYDSADKAVGDIPGYHEWLHNWLLSIASTDNSEVA